MMVAMNKWINLNGIPGHVNKTLVAWFHCESFQIFRYSLQKFLSRLAYSIHYTYMNKIMCIYIYMYTRGTQMCSVFLSSLLLPVRVNSNWLRCYKAIRTRENSQELIIRKVPAKFYIVLHDIDTQSYRMGPQFVS